MLPSSSCTVLCCSHGTKDLQSVLFFLLCLLILCSAYPCSMVVTNERGSQCSLVGALLKILPWL